MIEIILIFLSIFILAIGTLILMYNSSLEDVHDDRQ